MRAVWLIFRREWKSLFGAPSAYIILSIFIGLMGYFFFGLLSQFQLASLQYQSFMDPSELNLNDMVIAPLYSYVCILWLLLVPLITMRLIAEERKQQTFVLLVTAPVTLTQIVLGKFLAGIGFIALTLVICFIYPLICLTLGNADWGPVLSIHVGLLLMGAIFVALGLWASSVAKNPMLAAVIAFGLILFFWIVDLVKDVSEPLAILSEFSLLAHLEPFFKGIVDTYHVVFYGVALAFILFLVRSRLESERH